MEIKIDEAYHVESCCRPKTTTTPHMVRCIDFYFHFLANLPMLRDSEPGLPMAVVAWNESRDKNMTRQFENGRPKYFRLRFLVNDVH